MCVCMYVCVYVCMYVYIYTYIHIGGPLRGVQGRRDPVGLTISYHDYFYLLRIVIHYDYHLYAITILFLLLLLLFTVVYHNWTTGPGGTRASDRRPPRRCAPV